MTDTDEAFATRVTATLQAKVAQLPPITINIDAVSMSPDEPPRRNRRGRVLVTATVAIILIIVAAAVTMVVRSENDSDRHPAGPPVPIAARIELDARPTLSFQAKEFTTIAGLNQITLIKKGGTEAIQFDDPALAGFRLSVTDGQTAVGTVDLRAGRDYRIHSVIPGHAEAGVDAVIHVLPAGADGNPPLPAAVLRQVSQVSRIDGGPVHGTAEYTLSTRNTAVTALMQDEIPGDEQPVYVFVLRGSFVDPRADGFRPPSSSQPSTRSNLLTVVFPRSAPFIPLDVGTGTAQPDLATVGGAIRVRY